MVILFGSAKVLLFLMRHIYTEVLQPEPIQNNSHSSFHYRTTVDQINNEIMALDTRIKNIKKQIELPSTEQDVKSQMSEFLQVNQKLIYIKAKVHLIYI